MNVNKLAPKSITSDKRNNFTRKYENNLFQNSINIYDTSVKFITSDKRFPIELKQEPKIKDKIKSELNKDKKIKQNNKSNNGTKLNKIKDEKTKVEQKIEPKIQTIEDDDTNLDFKFILTKRGYEINKNKIDKAIIEEIKSDLTVSPFIMGDTDTPKFPVYVESKNKIIVPTFYGIEKFGQPEKNTLNYKNCSYEFKGELREHQIKIMEKTMNHLNTKNGGILSIGCGGGKCLAKDTPVMLFNSKTILVQHIQVGDKLMGDDSNERNVLSICSGWEDLYTIQEHDGINYTVNKSHILSLKMSQDHGIYKKNQIIDISVEDYLTLDNNMKSILKGYRVSIQFPKKVFSKSPYFIGQTVQKYPIIKDSNLLNLMNEKIEKIKYNDMETRKQFWQGFICENKNYVKTENGYMLYINSYFLLNSILFILRSLGYKCLELSGAIKIFNNHDNLMYDFTIKYKEYGQYYGFEIDNNRRFLLNDFTVTHNTVLAINTACRLRAKTLILVHKEFLLDQWVARLKQFTNAKIGILRQKIIPEPDCDIIVGIVHSICAKDYAKEIFADLKLLIIDECHHYASRVFSQVFGKCNAPYILGLSATPYRKDKLTKVLFWNIGKIFYRQKTKTNKQVICKTFTFKSKSKLFVEKKRWFKGEIKPDDVAMTTNIISIESRNKQIINILNELRKHPERKTLVLSDRVKHIQTLKNELDEYIKKDIENGILEPLEFRTYYYYGKVKKNKRIEAETEADMLFGTFDMAQEGLDIDGLNTIVLATSQKDVVQAVGRTTRKILKNGDVRPLVIDIIDDLSIYTNHAKVRQIGYNKNKYQIENYYMDDDFIFTDKYNNKTKWEQVIDLQKVKEEDEKITEKTEYIEIDPNDENADSSDGEDETIYQKPLKFNFKKSLFTKKN